MREDQKGFYCKSAALLDLATLQNSLDKAIQKTEAGNIKPSDAKTKANTLKGILSSVAPVHLRYGGGLRCHFDFPGSCRKSIQAF
jgi:hypothetical protein